MVKDPSSLGEFALFRGLAPADLQRINERLHRRVVPAGTNLIIADQPGEVVYLLVEGTVKILVEQPAAREVILAFLGHGDTVGEM
ncbi:MAG TPA: cyclic nucleotide-binding domain-containing protein, partial [Thermoanaerobaculia bacterium]|nr:cyclic nucleotide-binding domain-containing protein [Thermoanaerobaculia bacterium]